MVLWHVFQQQALSLTLLQTQQLFQLKFNKEIRQA